MLPMVAHSNRGQADNGFVVLGGIRVDDPYSHHPPRRLLDFLGQVSDLYAFTPRQICGFACQFQYAMKSPGAHLKLLHLRLQKALAYVVKITRCSGRHQHEVVTNGTLLCPAFRQASTGSSSFLLGTNLNQ